MPSLSASSSHGIGKSAHPLQSVQLISSPSLSDNTAFEIQVSPVPKLSNSTYNKSVSKSSEGRVSPSRENPIIVSELYSI